MLNDEVIRLCMCFRLGFATNALDFVHMFRQKELHVNISVIALVTICYSARPAAVTLSATILSVQR